MMIQAQGSASTTTIAAMPFSQVSLVLNTPMVYVLALRNLIPYGFTAGPINCTCVIVRPWIMACQGTHGGLLLRSRIFPEPAGMPSRRRVCLIPSQLVLSSIPRPQTEGSLPKESRGGHVQPTLPHPQHWSQVPWPRCVRPRSTDGPFKPLQPQRSSVRRTRCCRSCRWRCRAL